MMLNRFPVVKTFTQTGEVVAWLCKTDSYYCFLTSRAKYKSMGLNIVSIKSNVIPYHIKSRFKSPVGILMRNVLYLTGIGNYTINVPTDTVVAPLFVIEDITSDTYILPQEFSLMETLMFKVHLHYLIERKNVTLFLPRDDQINIKVLEKSSPNDITCMVLNHIVPSQIPFERQSIAVLNDAKNELQVNFGDDRSVNGIEITDIHKYKIGDSMNVIYSIAEPIMIPCQVTKIVRKYSIDDIDAKAVKIREQFRNLIFEIVTGMKDKTNLLLHVLDNIESKLVNTDNVKAIAGVILEEKPYAHIIKEIMHSA